MSENYKFLIFNETTNKYACPKCKRACSTQYNTGRHMRTCPMVNLIKNSYFNLIFFRTSQARLWMEAASRPNSVAPNKLWKEAASRPNPVAPNKLWKEAASPTPSKDQLQFSVFLFWFLTQKLTNIITGTPQAAQILMALSTNNAQIQADDRDQNAQQFQNQQNRPPGT